MGSVPRSCSAVVLAALAVPAVAHGATVTTDRACYRAGQQGTVTAAGFRPGATIDTMVEGEPMVNLLPDESGAASAPFLPLATPLAGDVPETLIATDATAVPPVSARVTYRVTETDVRMKPSTARSTSKVTWRLRGFGIGTAYLRVARRNKAGRTVTVRTIRLGKLKGPCGSLSRRITQLPLKQPKPRTTYVLRFGTTSRSTARALVERTVKTPSARKTKKKAKKR